MPETAPVCVAALAIPGTTSAASNATSPARARRIPRRGRPWAPGMCMDVECMQPPLLPPFRGSDYKRALAKP